MVTVESTTDWNKQRSKLIVGVSSAFVASCLLLFIIVLVIRRRRHGVRYMTGITTLLMSNFNRLYSLSDLPFVLYFSNNHHASVNKKLILEKGSLDKILFSKTHLTI